VRLHAPSNRGTIWLGLILVGSLLLAPVAWASGEDVREQGDAAKPEKKEAVKAKNEPDDDSEATPDASSEDESKEATVEAGFNTIEDVHVYRGPVDALWARAPRPAPEVAWREIDCRRPAR
jgi:hypothetical protein